LAAINAGTRAIYLVSHKALADQKDKDPPESAKSFFFSVVRPAGFEPAIFSSGG
jgi:hypothetical protein